MQFLERFVVKTNRYQSAFLSKSPTTDVPSVSQVGSSHHEKYRYRRQGFMDEISYNKLMRGVIIIRTGDVMREESRSDGTVG